MSSTEAPGTARLERSISRPRHPGANAVVGRNGPEGPESLAAALGVLGVALGAAELVAPRQVARLIGAPDSEAGRRTLRAMGVREIGSGAGVLFGARRAAWLWGRVAGDALDFALLAATSRQDGADRRRLAAAALAVAGVTAMDAACAVGFEPRRLGGGARAAWTGPVEVVKSIAIGRSPEELYEFWRDLEKLPGVMRHLLSVERLDERRSRWRAQAPLGQSVEWEAEMVEDTRAERLAWRSVRGSQIKTDGSVRFAPQPGGRGTILTVSLRYAPPGGAIGAAFAKLLGEWPGSQLQEDLRRFKQVMETGEVVLSEGMLASGHPARPPSVAELQRLRHGAGPHALPRAGRTA